MYFWLVCISSSKITHSGLERNKTELGWMCTISPLSKALYVPSICLCAALRKNDAAIHLRYSSMSFPHEDTLKPICSTFPRICLHNKHIQNWSQDWTTIMWKEISKRRQDKPINVTSMFQGTTIHEVDLTPLSHNFLNFRFTFFRLSLLQELIQLSIDTEIS